MSKLTLIEGTNVVQLRSNQAILDVLCTEIGANPEPSNQDLMTYAYRFMGLGKPIHAQKQLARLSSGYFDVMIYRDLFSSLCSRIDFGATSINDDFLTIVKSALTSFEILNFPEKPAFYRFRHDFHRIAGGLLNR